jgi:hypothetical protein
MTASQIERRTTYQVMPLQLFGACLTALGQMRAHIERQDVARGTILATVGAGLLAPVSELALALTPIGDRQTLLVTTWRARKRGGDRLILTAFLDAVEALIGRA